MTFNILKPAKCLLLKCQMTKINVCLTTGQRYCQHTDPFSIHSRKQFHLLALEGKLILIWPEQRKRVMFCFIEVGDTIQYVLLYL